MLRLAAVATWMTLAVLPLLPAGFGPAVGDVEQALAYGFSSLTTRMAFRATPSRFRFSAFAAAAGLFDICQLWLLGRTATIDKWTASMIGALAGLLIGRVVAHRLPRHFWLRTL